MFSRFQLWIVSELPDWLDADTARVDPRRKSPRYLQFNLALAFSRFPGRNILEYYSIAFDSHIRRQTYNPGDYIFSRSVIAEINRRDAEGKPLARIYIL